MPGTGHFPYAERPEEFAALLHAHLTSPAEPGHNSKIESSSREARC